MVEKIRDREKERDGQIKKHRKKKKLLLHSPTNKKNRQSELKSSFAAKKH